MPLGSQPGGLIFQPPVAHIPSRRLALLFLFTWLGGGAVALADDAPLDPVVVRNKIHTVQGRFELEANVGVTLVNRLVHHENFNLGLAYNFTDAWAIELRAGYASSGQTPLAGRVESTLIKRSPSGPDSELVVVNDLSNLWEMKANAVLGARWAPLYGKISLLTETSVHYQAYVWLGAGGATLHRQSAVYCRDVTSREEGTCGDWLTADKATVLGSAALGLRFFIGNHNSVGLELRNYVFPDSFLVNVDRTVSEAGGNTGTASKSPGLIDLVFLDVGYAYIF